MSSNRPAPTARFTNDNRYALAADIQTIPGLPTAPGYLNVDVDPETGEIDGLF